MSLTNWLHRAYLNLGLERDGLVVINLHEILLDDRERDEAPLRMGQGMTVAGIRRVLEDLTSAGYQSIAPQQLTTLDSFEERYLLLTMDDAYYHHNRLVPLLEEFEIHGVFFVPVDYIRSPRKYWWDAVHCAMMERGASEEDISHRIQSLKNRPTSEIESEIIEEFGREALTPEGNLDRPFTEGELGDLSESEYVHLGNHTISHDLLTGFTAERCREEIREARDFLSGIEGSAPRMIAYPFGEFNASVVDVARKSGEQLGFTEVNKKNYSADLSGHPMELGRFPTWGQQPPRPQVTSIRSDLRIPGWLDWR